MFVDALISDDFRNYRLEAWSGGRARSRTVRAIRSRMARLTCPLDVECEKRDRHGRQSRQSCVVHAEPRQISLRMVLGRWSSNNRNVRDRFGSGRTRLFDSSTEDVTQAFDRAVDRSIDVRSCHSYPNRS